MGLDSGFQDINKERGIETSMSAAIESFWRRRVWFAIIMGLNQGSESVVKRQDFLLTG